MSAGRFVWRELISENPAAEFYKALFGWTTTTSDMGGMTYTMFKLGSEDVGGAMKPQMPGVPPFWFNYLTVDDVDAAAAKIVSLGGKVLTPPMSAPGVGRWVVAQDPNGAAFAAFVGANPGATQDRTPPVGTFCWSQLMTNNLDRAVSFYVNLIGYDAAPMGAATVLSKDGVQRATVQAFPAGTSMPDHWLSYVAVDDVDGLAARATALGGKLAMPPTDVPGMGRFAVVSDTNGAWFAFWKAAN